MTEPTLSKEQEQEELSKSKPKISYSNIDTEQPMLSSKDNSERFCAKNRLSICFEITLLVLAVAVFTQIYFVPKVLNNAFDSNIQQTVVMTSSRQKANDNKYQHWQRNTFDDSGIQMFSFYIFNITNPEAVLNGSNPILQEIGPIVYRRYEFKEDIKFSANSCTVNYLYNYTYEFQPSMTTVDVKQNVTILDPAFLTLFNSVNIFASFGVGLSKTLGEYLKTLSGMSIFYQKSIEDVITGVVPPELLANTTGKSQAAMKYAMMNQATVRVTERTGYCNRYDLRVLELFWNTTEITYWKSPEEVYPARETRNWPWQYVTKEDTLLVWHQAFTRKVNYTFEQVVQNNGLDLWRFKLSDKTLKNQTVYPPNAQFYAMGPSGVLNLTVRKEFPEQTIVLLSFPHFYQGSYYYEQYGFPFHMNPPNQALDSTYFDMEPQTGIILNNLLGFQTNFQLFPLSKDITYPNGSADVILVSNFSNLPNILVPMGYQVVNAYAPSDVTSSLYNQLNLIKQFKDTSFYGGISLGVVLVALSVWLMCRRYQKAAIEKSSSNLGGEDTEELSMVRSQLEY